MLALDTESGAVHMLDRLAFLLLSKRQVEATKEFSQEEISSAKNDIETLTKNGTLFSAKDETAAEKAVNATPVLKAMCLHIAHACNLECRYCFARGGMFGGKRELMSADIAKASMKFLCEHSANRKNLEVDFFGGEPLVNFEVVKEAVEYAKTLEKEYNKKFRFTLTTNGLALTPDKIDYINENMYNVVLSLDGRKEINDGNRKTLDGRGCYDLILPKYRELVEKRGKGSFYVRGTYTADRKQQSMPSPKVISHK